MTDTVGFSVGAVARRLGVAPLTLRTWNRRYGIGAREFSPGRHRRYTAEDITRLEHMQKLILRGAAPADAARVALSAPVVLIPGQERAGGPSSGLPDADPPPQVAGILVPGAAQPGHQANGHGLAGQDPSGLPGESLPPARPGPGHGSGGQRLALPGASPAARGLARAVLALDEKGISEAIRAALARDGSVRTWEELLVPVLTGLGTRFEDTGTCVEAEHLLSSAIIAGFSRYAADRPGQGGTGPFCSPRPRVTSTACRCTRWPRPWPNRGSTAGPRPGPAVSGTGGRRPADRPGRGLLVVPVAGHRRSGRTAGPDPAPPGRPADPRRPRLGPEPIPAAARLAETLPEALAGVVAALGY